MFDTQFTVALPCWAATFLKSIQEPFSGVEAKMHLALDVARRNSDEKTGGPFGAAIFDGATNRLISLGMNLVTSANCSVLHAEIVAIMFAQHALGTYDLASKGSFVLATSCEPCAMCLGAIPWSGIKQVMCGASDADARAIGFDEGAKPQGWIGELERRGISVVNNLCRDEAAQVLRDYKDRGGEIYNTGNGSEPS